jgi:hypothetical protein
VVWGWVAGAILAPPNPSSAALCLYATAFGKQRLQVAPAVSAVELAALAVESFCAKDLIEPIGWIRGITEQEHRGDPLLDEPPRHMAKKKATHTLPVNCRKT